MPFILIALIAIILCVNPYLPLIVKQVLYAISLTIKSVIVFALPLIIFSLLFKTTLRLAHKATMVIGLILLCVVCSNATATFLSHYVGMWVYHFDMSLMLPKDNQGLMPAWSWQFPKLIANNKAMFLGIILGILLGSFKITAAERAADKINTIVNKILNSFVYFIPLFVMGFIVKLQYDGVVHTLLKDYTVIFTLVALAQFSYIVFFYAALYYFNPKETISAIRNILPAAIAGFSTMSSAAVMPMTLSGVEKNATNKGLSQSIIPATVNIHLLGDCFAIPIFAYAVMKSFAIPEPTLISYIIFVCYFVLAKFSVAAIPGGGIIVMLPILENYLGFNADMLSLITALYILFDPVITCANVLGNGAFAKLIDKMMSYRLSKKLLLTEA